MQEETSPQYQQTPPTVSLASEDQTIYLPGSAEKKRALLMYLLIGIIWSLGASQPKSVYEQYHLKQAMGRWTICLAGIVLSLILVFIPILKYLPLMFYMILIVILGLCIKQVKEGKYTRDSKNILSGFSGLGGRICDLFEIKI